MKRAGRQRSQLPTCYYEGYLEKRSFKDQASQKLWTCLCGSSLFFFTDKRDTDYVQKLDLSGFVSITDDSTQDRKLDAARLNLQMKDENIRFTVPSAEARELWKGFIRSVAELSVPSCLNLLPGQLQTLREAVEQERERLKSVSVSSLRADKPACYQEVSRLEAELLLEREAKRGNMLLRPGRGGNSFAVTTRQDLDGSVFRHYRVTQKHEGGFSIDVDTPVPCATLHHVVNYLVEQTDGVLIPLTFEGAYEKQISFISSDNENGEKSVQQANLDKPSLPPKPVSRVAPPEVAAAAAAAAVEEQSLYLNEEELERELQDSAELPLPYPKRAMMPPASRKWSSSTSTPKTSKDPKMKIFTEASGQIPQAALTELKLKLEQKALCVE